jgi:hypothetical protein
MEYVPEQGGNPRPLSPRPAAAAAAGSSRVEKCARLFDERQRGMGPQYSRSLSRRHPSATPKLLVLPPFRCGFDFHEVDRYAEEDAALHVLVAAERLTNDAAPQAGFFPRLVQRRLLRRASPLNGALGYSPTARGGSRDQAHGHRVPFATKRNRGSLLWSSGTHD